MNENAKRFSNVHPLLAGVLVLLLVPVAGAAETTREVFTANEDVASFGYDFAEDAKKSTSPGETPAIQLAAKSGDNAYLGLDLSDLGKYKMEAAYKVGFLADGFTSRVDVSFSTESTFTKGNGIDSGPHRNAVGMEFLEDGSAMAVRLVEKVDGARKVLDSRTYAGYGDHNGLLMTLSVDLRAGVASVRDSGGGVVLEAPVDSELLGNPITQHWVVGRGFSYGSAYALVWTTSGSGVVTDSDPLKPVGSGLKISPSKVDSLPWTVSLAATDDWGVASAWAAWTINGTAQADVSLARDGGTAVEGTYSTEMPAVECGKLVKGVVRLKDVSDLEATGGSFEFTTCSGEDANVQQTEGGGGGGGTVMAGGNAFLNAALVLVAALGLSLVAKTQGFPKARKPILIIGVAIALGFVFEAQSGFFSALRESVGDGVLMASGAGLAVLAYIQRGRLFK